MTREEERLCADLARVCELETERAIAEYVETIQALRTSDDDEVLRRMLRCVRDTEAGEVQYELVEACEGFSNFIPVFLSEGLEIQRVAPRWFRLMFQSLLNTESDADQVVDAIVQMAAGARASYERLVSSIATDDPQYMRVLARLQ